MAATRPFIVTTGLRALAGFYAGRAARLWPAPHQEYFALPAQRRHLAHAYITRIDRAPGLDAKRFRRDVMRARDAEFLDRWAPDAPVGLVTICGKMGEVAWKPREYRRLVALIAQSPEAAKVLRHADRVTFDTVQALEVLPATFRRSAIVRRVEQVHEAGLIRDVADLVDRLAAGRSEVLAERLERAPTRERFFRMLLEALRPKELPVPFADTARLRPLRTPKQVEDAGRRFKNCLATCVDQAAFGTAAFVEWRGDEPAVMELQLEGAAGWRLEELLGFENRQLKPETVHAVHKALAEQGVRVGRNADGLVWALEDCVRRAAFAADNAAQVV